MQRGLRVITLQGAIETVSKAGTHANTVHCKKSFGINLKYLSLKGGTIPSGIKVI